ncbi:MAG: TolC family protein [Bacteroidales bacterium]|nr:TolC family protein [Bacteroidales bacterium]
MKKSIIILLMAVMPGLTGHLASAQEKPWSLQECIGYALDHNLTVQQRELQVRQREIDANTARNSRLPGVSAGSSQNFSFGRGLTEDNTYAHTNTTNTSFTLGADMTLFNGFRIRNNILLGELNLKAATADLEKARDDIRVAVAQAYVQILYQREITEVAVRQVAIDSLQVERLETLLANGKATSADVAAQRASLAQSRLSAVQADNRLQLARLDLAQLLELPSPEGFDVATPAGDALELPLPAGPESIYEEAVGIKPAVQAEETRLAYAERNIDLARGGYFPSLSLSGGLGTNYYTSSGYAGKRFFDQLSNNFSQYIGLSLNIPVFSRLTTRNQVRSARVNYDLQQLQLESVKKQLYKEIQQAWYNALTARSKFESSTQAASAAEESFALMQAKYENGKASITEFNESKNQYLKACSDLAQARYEYLYQTRLLDFYRGRTLSL